MSFKVVDESERPFADVETFVRDNAAKGASGFVVIAFYADKAHEYAQENDGTVTVDTMIATLEKLKTSMVMSEIAEFEIVDDDEEDDE